MDDDPNGLLEFGIGVLHLEADQAFTILILGLLMLNCIVIFFFGSVCLPIIFNAS